MRRVPTVALAAVVGLLSASCEASFALGSTCSRSAECPAPLACRLGRCRTECVAQRDCPLGARCIVDALGAGSCALADDRRCPGTPCPAPLLCSSGACVNACDGVASCPPGSTCALDAERRGYCERDETDAGVPLDATGDAGCAGPSCDPVEEIALSGRASCARTRSGAVWCWGDGEEITAGDSPICPSAGHPCVATPRRARFDDLGVAEDVTGATWLAGGEYNFGVVIEGRAFTWGREFNGALGTNGLGEIGRAIRLQPGDQLVPDGVGGLRLGTSFGVAVGSMTWAWGAEDRAQRGRGVAMGSTFAELADPLPGAIDIVLGSAHGCGITPAGGVECWGANSDGQVDSRTVVSGMPTQQDTHTPIVGLPGPADALTAGRAHSCALVGEDVWCWGNRSAMGRAVETVVCPLGGDRPSCPPARVTRLGRPFRALGITVASNTTCAIDDVGGVWCWGEGLAEEPVPVELPLPARSVAIGPSHACALTEAGDVWCWGENFSGALGRGTAEGARYPLPAPVAWPEG